MELRDRAPTDALVTHRMTDGIRAANSFSRLVIATHKLTRDKTVGVIVRVRHSGVCHI